jgi:IclR family transcriptional regulator, acetate operon repressor
VSRQATADPAGSRAGTLERGLRILQHLATVGEATLAETIQATGLSRSATYRIAERLREWGFVETSPASEALRLGPEAARIGMAALGTLDVTRIAPPYLRALADQTKETVNLAVRDGDAVVYIHQEQGPLAVRMGAQLGTRRPLHCTALGKAYLAAMAPEEASAVLERLELTRLMPGTITDRAELAAELEHTRERGWAIDDEEVEEDVYCLGAVIRDRARTPIAAISVAGPAHRMRPRTDLLGALVAETSAAISSRLGFAPTSR